MKSIRDMIGTRRRNSAFVLYEARRKYYAENTVIPQA